MPILTTDEVADLVTTTLKNLGKGSWTDISTDLQDYVALPNLLRRDKVKFKTGQGIQFNVQVDDLDSAANVGLFQVDQVNVKDTMDLGSAPWRHTTANYAWDVREFKMNADEWQIVDLVETRRHAGMIALAKKMESNFWQAPPSSSDESEPYGVPYWIVQNATTGFKGNLPSGFTDVGGIVPANTPIPDTWKNYTFQYTNVTKTDFVRKARAAATKTNFKAPHPHPDYANGSRFGHYTTYNVIGQLEEALEGQNDNLGNDVASKDGMTLFRRVPVTWAPWLDENTSNNPWYGIDWESFYPCFLRGEYMLEDGPNKAANQHKVLQVHVDLTYNFVCVNRRANFVGNTA